MLHHHDIRRAGPADQPAIEALVELAYSKWVPIIGGRPLPMRADYGAALRDHRIDLLGSAGSIEALIETSLEPDHLLVVNIAVAPAAQGRGLGTSLLKHAEDLAREAGRGELRLYTNSLMIENVALYRRRGYRISHEERVTPDWTVVHMVKPL